MLSDLIDRIKKNELYKNILLLISGNGLAQLIPLLLYPVIARLYSPEEFGVLAFVVGIHSVFLIISTCRYDFSIILPKSDSEAGSLYNTALSIALSLSLVIPLIVLLARNLTPGLIKYQNITLWLYLLSITVFTTAYAQIIGGWNTRFKLFKAIVFYTLSLNILTSTFKLILGLLNIRDGLLISFVLAQSFALVFYWVYMRRKSGLPGFRFFSTLDLKVAGGYANFPKYNMPHALVNTLSINLPVFLLTFYFSEHLTGQFSVASALLFRPISVYANSVSQALSQKVVELINHNHETWPIIKKFLGRTFLMSLLPAALIAVFAPFIFTTALGKNWLEAGQLCRLILPWSLTVLLGGSLAFIPNVFQKQLYALIVDIIYILLRVVALGIGIYYNNAFLGIGLFSLAGVLVIGYLLLWYRKVLKHHDMKIKLIT
jgi:O-antigen/teichoic acid export membrane protein